MFYSAGGVRGKSVVHHGGMVPAGRDWIEHLPAELDGQRAIMRKLLDWSQRDERVRCLVVACSVGRGNADRLSDLDMGMQVASEDFEAAVADVHEAVDGLADLVESYQHKIDGLAMPHRRIFAQYANRCQVDLVVIAAGEDYGPIKDEVVLYDPDGLRTATFEPQEVTPTQVRDWAFNGWACLADVGKYLRRGSAWEALERLHQARAECWRLLATAHDVPNPQFGITSLLDFAPDQVPASMADTVSDLDLAGLAVAAARLADCLNEAGDLLKPDQRAVLPTAMASYITADLAAIRP
ncbi:MAG TPA: hypothetical protein VEV63_11310 [Streptosporangiaceae bacterium]|nr:hypothetical protein [Streptosporangiaceae bacterium]